MRKLAGVLVLISCVGITSAAAEDQDKSEIWPKLRQGLFGNRAILEDDGTRLALELPKRAADASAVPLAIRARQIPGDSPLRKIYLVIDKNPSPVGAIFEFGSGGHEIALETRVRIEDYTWVRAIAEMTDGSLLATKRYIKASGGCSAPAGKSLAQRLAGMGQMKWRIDPPLSADGQSSVQLLIRHPNNSGLAMDQLTRLFDPPHFIRSVRITRGEELVFSANVDFTISENPAFRFSLPPGGDGDLHAEVTDTNDLTFESAARVSVSHRD